MPQAILLQDRRDARRARRGRRRLQGLPAQLPDPAQARRARHQGLDRGRPAAPGRPPSRALAEAEHEGARQRRAAQQDGAHDHPPGRRRRPPVRLRHHAGHRRRDPRGPRHPHRPAARSSSTSRSRRSARTWSSSRSPTASPRPSRRWSSKRSSGRRERSVRPDAGRTVRSPALQETAARQHDRDHRRPLTSDVRQGVGAAAGRHEHVVAGRSPLDAAQPRRVPADRRRPARAGRGASRARERGPSVA